MAFHPVLSHRVNPMLRQGAAPQEIPTREYAVGSVQPSLGDLGGLGKSLRHAKAA